MQIERNRSSLNFRTRRRRRNGCLPITLFIGVLLGTVFTSWQWLGVRLSTMTPQQADADLRASELALERGDLDAAIRTASQRWASHSDQVEVLTLLVRALIYRSYADYNHDDDRETALELTTEAIDRMPGNLDVMAIHAYALQAYGQPAEAARIAGQVLNRQASHTLARIAQGLAYGRVGSYETALRENQRAASADDYKLDTLRALAISLSDMGRYREAAQTVDQAIELNPRLAILHFERALYAMQVGDMDRATAAYFRILAFDPENVKARLRMCELSSLLAERELAIEYCLDVTERAPTWADGWHRLGREYFFKGEFLNAQRSLQRCSTLQIAQGTPVNQRQFECWYLQGQAAEILGDCDGLMRAYNEFKAMATTTSIPQTWTYPPEGPEICAQPTNSLP